MAEDASQLEAMQQVIESLRATIADMQEELAALRNPEEPSALEPGGPSPEGIEKKLEWFEKDTDEKIVGHQHHIDEIYRRLQRLTEGADGGGDSSPCVTTSPVVIGVTGEGTEGADTDEWEAGGGAVDVYMTSRVLYDENGDQVLYGYKRLFRFDSCGKCYSISAETEYEINTPDAECPEE